MSKSWCDRLTNMEILSLESKKTADEAMLDSGRYSVVAIPAKVQSSGKLDLQEAAGLVQATVVADQRQFRRRFARWVGKVCHNMSSAGESEDAVAQFRRGGALFLVKIGVGTKAFAFGGRKSDNDESRYELYFRASPDTPTTEMNAAFRGNEMPIIAQWDTLGSKNCVMYFFTSGMVEDIPTDGTKYVPRASRSASSGASASATSTTTAIAATTGGSGLKPISGKGVHNWNDFVNLLTKFEDLFLEISGLTHVLPVETQVPISKMVTPEALAKLNALGVHFPEDGANDKEKATTLFNSFDEDFTDAKHGHAGQTHDSKLLQPEFVTACAYATPSSGAANHDESYTIPELQAIRNHFEDAFDEIAGRGANSVTLDKLDTDFNKIAEFDLVLPPAEFELQEMLEEMKNQAAEDHPNGEVEIHLFEMFVAFFQNPGALHHE